MKKIILIIGMIGLLFLLGCTIKKDITTPIEREIPLLNSNSLQAKQCADGGGQWRWFTNGCVDACIPKPAICTMATKEGCDCGATKCYGSLPCDAPVGASCPAEVILGCRDDPYEPYATSQEACEKTGGNWTTKAIGGGCFPDKLTGGTKCVEGRLVDTCNCSDEKIFYLDGCANPRLDLMSIIAYG